MFTDMVRRAGERHHRMGPAASVDDISHGMEQATGSARH
jgi:hypothetical protein